MGGGTVLPPQSLARADPAWPGAVVWVADQRQGSNAVLTMGKGLAGRLLSVVLAPGSRGPGGWRWPWC